MAMSLKQKLHFGSKRVRAAAKAAMKAKRTRKRSATAKKHRTRTKPNPAPKKRRRTVSKARRKSPRKNLGEIISLTMGNPAKRRKKAVAKTKRRKKASAPRSNSAGRRRAKKNPGHRRRSVRRNPGGYGMRDLVALGGGAVLGGTLPKLASQMVLGTKNTGFMGYLANLAGTGLLAFAASKFAPRERMLVAGVIAGGVGQVISRVLSDYTSVGQYLQGAGMGDYMAANWVTPQILPNALNSAVSSNGYQAPQLVMTSAGAGTNVSALTGAPIY